MSAEVDKAVEAVERAIEAVFVPSAPVHQQMALLAKVLREREVLLSEAWGFMRDASIDWSDSEGGSLSDRISEHLGVVQ